MNESLGLASGHYSLLKNIYIGFYYKIKCVVPAIPSSLHTLHYYSLLYYAAAMGVAWQSPVCCMHCSTLHNTVNTLDKTYPNYITKEQNYINSQLWTLQRQRPAASDPQVELHEASPRLGQVMGVRSHHYNAALQTRHFWKMHIIWQTITLYVVISFKQIIQFQHWLHETLMMKILCTSFSFLVLTAEVWEQFNIYWKN